VRRQREDQLLRYLQVAFHFLWWLTSNDYIFSLYPWCCKCGEFPVGNPKIISDFPPPATILWHTKPWNGIIKVVLRVLQMFDFKDFNNLNDYLS
jgi:hypothetical protein